LFDQQADELSRPTLIFEAFLRSTQNAAQDKQQLFKKIMDNWLQKMAAFF
jgi:hypothetical protein